MGPDVTLLVLLYVLQQLIVPIDVVTPRGSATVTNDCKVYCLSQVWLPWHARFSVTTLDRYLMGYLAGHVSVLVFVVLNLI